MTEDAYKGEYNFSFDPIQYYIFYVELCFDSISQRMKIATIVHIGASRPT